MSSGHLTTSIKQGDAVYGPGVYGTELPPSTPFYKVLTNNYGLDGGVTGNGKDKKDRADYVFAFEVDLNADTVQVVNDTERSVVTFGGGEEMSLAEDVAKLEEADERLEEILEEEWRLRKLFFDERWPFEGSYELEFWYMDQLNFEKYLGSRYFLEACQTWECSIAGLTVISRTERERVSPKGQLCLDQIPGLVGFDKVVVAAQAPLREGACRLRW